MQPRRHGNRVLCTGSTASVWGTSKPHIWITVYNVFLMVFILLKPIVNLYLFSYFIDFMKINFETLVSVFIRVP